MWAKVSFYKKQSGKFKSFRPNGNLEANTGGKLFVSDCQTQTDLSASCVKKDDRVEAMHKPNLTFGTRKAAPTMPLANGIARLTAIGATRTVLNAPLW